MAFVLAIDQGTTNSKALLLDETGRIVKKAAAPVGVSYPQPGWVEQSGSDIWRSVQAVSRECLAAAEGKPIAAIGISNQRESVLVWDRETGEPIGPSITWQCRRSAGRIAAIRTPAVERRVQAITGLGLDPLFPAAKLAWLLDAYPVARERAGRGQLCAGTIDSWLVFKLTGGRVHATDFGNASRTQLFDIVKGAWSPELLALFDVPAAIMAEPRASNGDFGVTDATSSLPPSIPIRAVMGDSHAALFGHGIRKPGAVKATYGTGSSLMTLTDGPVTSRSGLSTTIAWRAGARTAYALEGNITVSAQAAAWTASILGLPDALALTDLAASVPDNGGVTFVPALAGLGAPHWQENARAVFSGMSLATRPAHLARATLEAIALQVRDVFVAMEQDTGTRLEILNVDGGATDNDLLMQLEADILQRPLQRKAIAELSAAGAASMAGAAVDLWGDDGPPELGMLRDVITPQVDPPWRSALIDNWTAALRRATT